MRFNEWFYGWTEATSLPEYGGRLFGCTQCQQSRIVYRTLSPSDTDGFELVAGRARLQWIWICVRQNPDFSDPSVVGGHYSMRILYGDDEVFLREGITAAADYGGVAAIRARQTNPSKDITLQFWRFEGEENHETEFLFSIAGRVGYVSDSELPPWQTDL